MRVTAFANQGDGIQAHKNALFCRGYTNRVVIPPAAINAVVAQRGASVAALAWGENRLTEKYRRRRYEMSASHSAVRRTLAGRGEPRTPSQKSHKERSVIQ